MDRGAWYATVYGVAKSRARLSNFTSLQVIFRLYNLNRLYKLEMEQLPTEFVHPSGVLSVTVCSGRLSPQAVTDAREVWAGGRRFLWPQALRRRCWPEPQQLGGPGLPPGGTCQRGAGHRDTQETGTKPGQRGGLCSRPGCRGAVRVSGPTCPGLSFLVFHRRETA